jgi:hypothetical protein
VLIYVPRINERARDARLDLAYFETSVGDEGKASR